MVSRAARCSSRSDCTATPAASIILKHTLQFSTPKYTLQECDPTHTAAACS